MKNSLKNCTRCNKFYASAFINIPGRPLAPSKPGSPGIPDKPTGPGLPGNPGTPPMPANQRKSMNEPCFEILCSRDFSVFRGLLKNSHRLEPVIYLCHQLHRHLLVVRLDQQRFDSSLDHKVRPVHEDL